MAIFTKITFFHSSSIFCGVWFDWTWNLKTGKSKLWNLFSLKQFEKKKNFWIWDLSQDIHLMSRGVSWSADVSGDHISMLYLDEYHMMTSWWRHKIKWLTSWMYWSVSGSDNRTTTPLSLLLGIFFIFITMFKMRLFAIWDGNIW